MQLKKEELISRSILLFIFISIVIYVIFLQFLFPVLYEVDGYYHVAVAKQIKDFGPHHKFSWAQFSVFKDVYADKDFLFHIFIIPFFYLSHNIILVGKYAVIFYNILFLLAYIFILRKYLPNFLAGLFLLLLFVSPMFTIYFLFLRPATLSNIFLILSIYCMIHKRYIWLGILSLLYPLAHVSFFIIVICAFCCEIVRYILQKEFYFRNVYVTLIASILGCFLHPNYPNNLLIIYLNAFLVPWYSFREVGIDFGMELFPVSSKMAFISNFILFFTLNSVLLVGFLKRVRVSFSTIVWWVCAGIYLFLSFSSSRFWYVANVLFFVFFASYVKDWAGGRSWRKLLPKLNLIAAVFIVAALLIHIPNSKDFLRDLKTWALINTHYENVARWMNKNIPKGEIVYHANWCDSPYFICLNPANRYLVVLDPIFMYYRYPKVYSIYRDLKLGRVRKPYKILRSVFRINYGYVFKNSPLSLQVKEDPQHFKILYNDYYGIVFKIIYTPAQKARNEKRT